MTLETFFRAMNYVARIGHTQRDGLFVRPVARGVRTEPRGGGAVAIFAGDAFRQFERADAEVRRWVEHMASEALRRIFSLRIEFQNPGDAFADFSGKGLIRAAVFIRNDPHGIFVLENAAA